MTVHGRARRAAGGDMPRLLLVLLVALTLGAAAPARAARQGLLRVKSTPAGAAVWVDGVPAGVAPVSVPVFGGSHRVSVALPGHAVQTRRVSLKRGQRKTVHARLQAVPALTPEERAASLALFESRSARLREWKALNDLPFAFVAGIGGLGAPAGAGLAQYDPEIGLYYTADSLVTGAGVLIRADFFLDEALTQPAGRLDVSLNFLSGFGRVDYEFTAGPVAGASAEMTALQDGDVILLWGEGVLSDGSTWEADFAIVYGWGYTAFGGGVDLIAPDATKEHWSVEGSSDGTWIEATTSDGYRLTGHVAADGAGSAVLEHVPTGTNLALVQWTAEGQVTITHADGVTEAPG